MKKQLVIILVSILFGALLLKGANLVQDYGFDSEASEECFYVQNMNGSVKVTRITEDMTWNKCLKMEVVAIRDMDGRKLLSSELVFGKTNGKPGFVVEPNTVYNYSFDFRGNQMVSLHVGLDPEGKPEWKRSKTNIRPNPQTANPNEQNWSSVKGTFKTNGDAKYLRFRITFWADSKQQSNFTTKVGNYILLDNVRIEKRPSLDDASSAPSKASALPRKDAYLMNSTAQVAFKVVQNPWFKGIVDVPGAITWQDKGKSIVCKVAYDEPANGSHSHSKKPKPTAQNGKAIWNDNVAEVFLSMDAKDKEYVQFACSASGGRCRIVNGKEDDALEKWSASFQSQNGKCEYTFEIPYSLIGCKAGPAPGTLIKFNAGINHNRIPYGFAPTKTGFSDVSNFVLLGVGGIEDYQKAVLTQIKKDAPESMLAKIDAFSKAKFNDLASAILAAETLKSQIISAKMGSAPFVLARLPLNGNFSAPLEVGLENVVKEEIKLKAAGKEIAMVPLVIVNCTARTASYRVLVHDDAKNFYEHENHTLNGDFPPENIILREGIQAKDSDAGKPGVLFDALPRLNEAQVVTAAAGEAALVWLELDATGVKPGKYAGFVRVIPLSEPAVHNVRFYKGEIRDYPISLEVLPFELPAPRPGWLCSSAGTNDHLKYMLQIGPGRVHVTPYLFKQKFNLQGDLIDDNGSTERAVAAFRHVIEQYRQLNAMHVKRKILYGYSVYRVFAKVSMPKGMKELTPEWENCWRNHLKSVRNAIIKSGVGMDEVAFEVFDEPRGRDFELVLKATQIMRETLPDAILLMTWPCQNFEFTADMIKHFDDLLDEQVYHWQLGRDPAYRPLIHKNAARKGKIVGLYQCSTMIREDLHNYYRLHPWRIVDAHGNMLDIYQFSNMHWGKCGATDWKSIPSGAIVYRSANHCIPSIRFMMLRRGVDDIRYLDALKPYAKNADVANFLKDAPQRVLNATQDASMPDQMRDEVIKLLKKYQKGM
ncbi:MAG: hypothetical protein J5746_01630 [Victivallales bacterium]|nr:hypothetical protein [Victivallales bacterium]